MSKVQDLAEIAPFNRSGVCYCCCHNVVPLILRCVTHEVISAFTSKRFWLCYFESSLSVRDVTRHMSPCFRHPPF